jgi:hypothetical protein
MTRPELLPDRWLSRDLSVLIEAMRHFDESSQPLPTIASTLGRDVGGGVATGSTTG